MSNKIEKSSQDGSMNKNIALSLLLLFSSIGLFWFALKEENENLDNEGVYLQQSENAINDHLKRTARKIEEGKIKVQVENLQSKNAANRIEMQSTDFSSTSHSNDFKSDPRLDELTQSLGKNKKEPAPPKSPKEVIQAQMYDNQQWNEYTLSYRQSYADKFVENARRQGWVIKLDSEYKIISAKPLKKDVRPQLFPLDKTADANGARSGQ